MKLRTFVAGLLMAISFGYAQAQPTWVTGTPSIVSVGPLSVTVNFGINVSGTVYIIIFNSNVTTALTSSYVRTNAIAGPSGGMVATAVITVTAGQATLTLQQYFALFNTSRMHALYIVAANSAGTLQSDPVRLAFTTLPCPKIQLFNFFANLSECVNSGAQAMWQVAQLGALPMGILNGTTWTVDWGDGSPVWTYTSTADDDLPPAQLHSFSSTLDCAYVGTWTVQSPCGEFLNSSSVFVVHGREIPIDGDGDIQMEEPISGDVDITYVCAGVEHNLAIEDITIWNCQHPNVPAPLVAQPNNSNRYIQFVYGETPAGAVMNTITGDVYIAGTNIANWANGWVGPVLGPFAPPNPNTLSDIITIPATCQAGERFYVYLKYWNKCNPFADPNLNYVDDFFIIEVIDAPDEPNAPSHTFCFGDVDPTITATPNLAGNTINWYSDAALTNLLYTGVTFTHGLTAVGTYHFYATETSGVNGCEGPAADVAITIIPSVANNTISAAQSICYNTTPSGLTGLVPTGGSGTYTYEWQRSTTSATTGFGTAPGANTGQNYAPGALTTTTWYRRAVTSGPCTDNSPAIRIQVYGNLTAGTVGVTQNICYNTTPATLTEQTAPTGGTGTYTYQWQSSPNNSTWTNISGATSSSYSPGALTADMYYRRQVTSGTCGTVSSASVLINVYDDLQPGSVGSDQSICYGTSPANLTEVTAPSGGTGSYTYRWFYSTDNTNWTSISGATSANYSPGNLTSDRYYRRRVISGTCGTVYSNSVFIDVGAQLTAGAIGTDQSICYNTAPAELTEIIAPTGGIGSYTYQWQISTNGTAWSNISGATSSTYTSVALTANRYFRRQVTSGTCGTVNSASVLITVYGNLTAGTVGNAQSICYNTAPATLTQQTAPTGGTGTYTYQWQVSTNNSTWFDITAATSSSFTAGALTSNRYYRRNVTSGTCGTVSSASVLITVYPNLTAGTVGSGQTICYNTAPAALTQLTAPTGGSGTYSYQWQSSPNNTVWTDISGATSSGYSPGALTAETYFRRNVTSSSCATVSSPSVQISLYSTLTLAQLNSNASICNGTSTNFNVVNYGRDIAIYNKLYP